MPDRVNVANVTCPAGTPVGAPVETYFTQFPPGIPRKLTIVIPDGHAGLTGIALGYGHQPILPDNTGAYISGNDESIPFDLTNYSAGPLWSAFTCNLDLIDHSWQIRLEFDEIIQSEAAPLAQPLDLSTLNAAAPFTVPTA